MTIEELAHEIYDICRDSRNNFRECMSLISANLIGNNSYINNEILQRQVRTYRERRQGLSELAQLVFNLKQEARRSSLI